MTGSKARLAIELSKLKVFDKPDLKLEQYPTDSEVAAAALWNASMNGDIEDKVVADLGCGTGVLGIGCLLLGANKVFFVEKDHEALKILEKNLKSFRCLGEAEIVEGDVEYFAGKADVVVQNPPFGTKQEHADKAFLERAFATANTIYSFHKTSTQNFVEAISADHGFEVTHKWKFSFPLKQTQEFHKSRIKRIEVTCFRIHKSGNLK